MSNTDYISLPFNPKLKERAKEKRKEGLLHEVILWKHLKGKQINGLDFHRQKIIGNYIVDFYNSGKGIVIEVDGSSHNDKAEYDELRDAYLTGLGLKVIHITAKDVLQNIDNVIKFLLEETK